MNDTVENLVIGLLERLDEQGVILGGNVRELALLDARSADAHIITLEDVVEDLASIWYDPDERLDKAIYDELKKSEVLFEDEGHLEDVVDGVKDAVEKAMDEFVEEVLNGPKNG